MNSYVVKTLGCKANLYDSQLMEAELQKRGWKPAGEGENPGLCIVNSCTVTDEADRQSRKTASRLSRDNPSARVVVTGCAAEVDPERLAKSKGIHYVIGNRNKPEMISMILNKIAEGGVLPSTGELLGKAEGYSEMLSRHPIDRDWYGEEGFVTPPVQLAGHSDKTRAFLKLQEGCNSFCTYCVIPYGRGPSRSLRPREVISQIRELASQGIREVVITGTNIGDYGMDWSPENTRVGIPLVELFKLILDETTLERLRVSSLDPVEITPELMRLMESNPRFCPHFHVSLQSAQSRTLRMMKRKYTAVEVEKCLQSIAKIPGDPFVGMDIITGFPGETEEEFEKGVELLERLPWGRLHVFPYSEREGTPATRLPNSVPQHIRVKRAKRLSALSMKRLEATYQKVLDAKLPLDGVLLEREGNEWVSGYTANYIRVLLPKGSASKMRNQIVKVMPTGIVVDQASGDVALVSELL
jgi:threonylcarbamoyladenosine tRNA methylthiotransferase MtaB